MTDKLHPLVELLDFDQRDLVDKDGLLAGLIDPTPQRFSLVDLWVPSDENLDVIFRAALEMNSDEVIARCAARVTDAYWAELKSRYPIIDETIVSGRRTGEKVATEAVMAAIVNPTTKARAQCAMFLLKAKAGWNQTIELQPKLPQNQQLKDVTSEDLLELVGPDQVPGDVSDDDPGPA